MIGTFKEKVNQVLVRDQAHLRYLLPQFQFWYNQVRPHSYLDGRTPMEVWDKVDVFSSGYKRVYWFEEWGGLLTGYYLKNLRQRSRTVNSRTVISKGHPTPRN